MVNKVQASYWAAIIDGEGYVGISKHNRKGRSRYPFEFRPNVAVCLGKGSFILYELKEEYGGCIYLRKDRNPKWIDITVWSLAGSSCKNFLLDVLPYLRIKRKQAKLILEFLEIQGEGGQDALYSYVKGRQIEIYNELRLLNARGKTEPELVNIQVTEGERVYVKFEAEALRRMYWDEKMSMADIAKKFGVSFGAVKGNFDRFGIPRRSRSEFAKMGSDRSDKIKLFASKDELFRAYVEEEKSLRAVGREFGVSHVQVLKALRRYEIPRRDRVLAVKKHFKERGKE